MLFRREHWLVEDGHPPFADALLALVRDLDQYWINANAQETTTRKGGQKKLISMYLFGKVASNQSACLCAGAAGGSNAVGQ